MYFDGSDVGLADASVEDVDSFDVASNGDIHLSTLGDFAVSGVSGFDEDVFLCTPTSLGDVTACSYSPALFFDGSLWALDANDVDGVNLPLGGMGFQRSSPLALNGAFLPVVYRVAPLQQSGSLTLTPIDDAYIQSASPTINSGSAPTLQVDNSPILHFLIKFDVTGVNGQSIANAKLRLYNTNSSSIGGNFYRVADNSWQEETVTWNNAPAADTTLLASLGSVSPDTWYDVDITSLITGDGTYSLRVSSTSTNGADYSSKEGNNPPQLVITLAGTPTPTVTPVATNTPTSTPTLTATATPNVTDTFTPTFTPTSIPSGPITINYVYDLLNRVKEANYSNGDYYHYTYDAVGNRLSQTTSISGQVSTINYVYDDANRIETVNGVSYEYDNNGNLKNDGVNAYEYDSANRLISFSNASTTASYAYNGLNDRLQETVNGVTTTFTMDLNTGLTQALSDGTNTYIYGLGRIAQVNTSTEYFLGDALGSVRQLANSSGSITYARAYDPYGVVTSTSGTASTTYGYTSESYGDSTQLLYLRARFYAPGMGHFLTRDTWAGIYSEPITLNRWAYVRDNPVLLTDPSGHCDIVCIIAILIALGVITTTSSCSTGPEPAVCPLLPDNLQPDALKDNPREQSCQ
jgi:RHS repeat-associated protein